MGNRDNQYVSCRYGGLGRRSCGSACAQDDMQKESYSCGNGRGGFGLGLKRNQACGCNRARNESGGCKQENGGRRCGDWEKSEASVQRSCGCGLDRAHSDQPLSYSSDCHALMHQLQMVDFSIQETILYLDAYPNCREAQQYYRQLLATRKALAAKYEANCGPLSIMGNLNDNAWDWVKAPWPWHPDFPGNKRG